MFLIERKKNMEKFRTDSLNRTNKRKQKRKLKPIFKRSILLFFSAAIIISISIFFFQSLKATKVDKSKKVVNHVLKKKTPLQKVIPKKVVDINNDSTIDDYLK